MPNSAWLTNMMMEGVEQTFDHIAIYFEPNPRSVQIQTFTVNVFLAGINSLYKIVSDGAVFIQKLIDSGTII